MRCLAIVLVVCTPVAYGDTLRDQARAIVERFAGQLKPALVGSLRDKGPAAAVEVCAEAAPRIAAELSAETGWQVRRVSLKARNRSTAIPDAWASGHLKRFDELALAGEPAKQLWAEESGAGVYRFLKAQPVEPLCLVCHGQEVSPQIQAQLDHYYPADQATGYVLGEIRGAFYLTQEVVR